MAKTSQFAYPQPNAEVMQAPIRSHDRCGRCLAGDCRLHCPRCEDAGCFVLIRRLNPATSSGKLDFFRRIPGGAALFFSRSRLDRAALRHFPISRQLCVLPVGMIEEPFEWEMGVRESPNPASSAILSAARSHAGPGRCNQCFSPVPCPAAPFVPGICRQADRPRNTVYVRRSLLLRYRCADSGLLCG